MTLGRNWGYEKIFSVERLHAFKAAIERKMSTNVDKELKILEIGCGGGGVIKDLEAIGMSNMISVGMDIDYLRLKTIQINALILQGDGSKLAFRDRTFDVIIQATVFTSVLDDTKKGEIAKEILRALKDDGLLLWHDFQYDNPFNRNVKGIKLEEIKRLFPKCFYKYNTVHANPLITRPISKYSIGFAKLLDKIRFLHTHLFVEIRKQNTQ